MTREVCQNYVTGENPKLQEKQRTAGRDASRYKG
jgi:hypothetical protein